MPESSHPLGNRVILDDDRRNVEDVPTELLLDLQDGAGTQHLARTCYGQAVRDCIEVSDSRFILVVQPDLRALLYRQLQKNFRVYRVCRFQGEPDGRIVPTRELYIEFRPTALNHERRSALREHVAGADRIADPQDGFYPLSEKMAENPAVAALSLEFETAILSASPVVIEVARADREAERVDLLKRR